MMSNFAKKFNCVVFNIVTTYKEQDLERKMYQFDSDNMYIFFVFDSV